MTRFSRTLFAAHASLEAIDAGLRDAQRACAEADGHRAWLTELRAERARQVQAGTWPPAVEGGAA